jgi:hypothetical protein
MKKTTYMACRTPHDLNLYFVVEKKKKKSIDVEIQVGYWVVKNHSQDYKIYATMICMFDKDFLNSLLQPPINNPCPAHLTNRNYKTRLLRQFDYLLRFVFLNKYSLDMAINNKWPKKQSNPKKNEYESPKLVYCKEKDAVVPLVRVGFQTLIKMQGSWNDDDHGMLEAMVESSKRVDKELGPNFQNSPQYYHK